MSTDPQEKTRYAFATFADVPRRKWFAPNEVEEAAEYINAVLEASDAPPAILADDVPEGFGLLCAVLSQQVPRTDGKGRENKPVLFIAWPAPSLELLQSTPDGRGVIADALQYALAHQLLRPIRTAEDPEGIRDRLPVTLADWTEPSKREGILSAYNEAASALLKELRAKNAIWRAITPQTLRECIASAAKARELFPRLEELGAFVRAAEVLRETAAAAGKPTSLYDDWLAGRNEAAGYEDVDSLEDLGI